MRKAIEDIFDNKPAVYGPEHFALFERFKAALNAGEIRAAEPDASAASGWRVNGWVKKGILLGFRMAGLWICPSIPRGSLSSISRPIRCGISRRPMAFGLCRAGRAFGTAALSDAA